MIIDDIKNNFISDGFKWFEKYTNMDTVLETLLYEKEELYGTHGFGRIGSPIRNYTGGYIALSMEKFNLAKSLLSKAIDSNCFKDVEDIMKEDYENL